MSKDTTIEAQTFTCQYIQREDRLLLAINYQDIENRIDFWITRSFLLKLLPYFFDYISHTDTQSIENEIEINNYSSPTDTSTFVLMQKEPILLDSVDFKRLDSKDVKIVFKNTQKKISCVASLEQGAFDNVAKLIVKSAPAMEWGTYTI